MQEMQHLSLAQTENWGLRNDFESAVATCDYEIRMNRIESWPNALEKGEVWGLDDDLLPTV